jgi:hypothetical protein
VNTIPEGLRSCLDDTGFPTGATYRVVSYDVLLAFFALFGAQESTLRKRLFYSERRDTGERCLCISRVAIEELSSEDLPRDTA